MALAIAGGILAQNMITSPDVVSAATPSDACFAVGWSAVGAIVIFVRRKLSQ